MPANESRPMANSVLVSNSSTSRHQAWPVRPLIDRTSTALQGIVRRYDAVRAWSSRLPGKTYSNSADDVAKDDHLLIDVFAWVEDYFGSSLGAVGHRVPRQKVLWSYSTKAADASKDPGPIRQCRILRYQAENARFERDPRKRDAGWWSRWPSLPGGLNDIKMPGGKPAPGKCFLFTRHRPEIEVLDQAGIDRPGLIHHQLGIAYCRGNDAASAIEEIASSLIYLRFPAGHRLRR
jgi:hypothetical protein